MLKIDQEFKNLIPELSKEEFEQLEKNCIAEGIRDSIKLWSGTDIIIDGHNRYKIALDNNLKYETYGMGFDTRDDVIDWMINNQLGRRNLSKETQSYLRGLQYSREKKKVGAQEENKNSSKNEVDILTTSNKTVEKLAEQHNVSPKTIQRDEQYAKAVDEIVKNTTPEVK
ncbi:MAG: hypothetical protein RLZZ577_69 [Bacteroidota bacterium]|jgi:hypothetical protein